MSTFLKIAFVLLITIISPFCCSAQLALDWAMNTTGQDYSSGICVASDGDQNIYVCGQYSNTTDFDPSSNLVNLTSNGVDAFLAKYDANGNFLWVFKLTGTYPQYPSYIALDTNGNVYMTGRFQSTVDFDPSVGIANLTPIGNSDFFIAKYDTDGNYLWAHSAGSSEHDGGENLSVDSSGNVYVTGRFQNTVDFDPTVTTVNITSNGGDDIFVAKYDFDGNFIWVKSFGGTSTSDGAYGLALDGDNIYLTGEYMGPVDFDPSLGSTYLTSVDNADAFFAKYNLDGDFIWAKSFSGTGHGVGIKVKIDENADVLLCGEFLGSTDFDPDLGSLNLNSYGDEDIYLAKYDSDGGLIWAENLGGSNTDIIHDIELDESGNIYATGSFESTADFDPSSGDAVLTSDSWTGDLFMAKYDQDGNYYWAQRIGGNQGDDANNLALGNTGEFYVTGVFGGNVDFDPSSGNSILSDGGSSWCMFLAKYHECSSTSSTEVITACNSFTWIDGITYTSSSDTATFIIPNASGCDSLITLDLTIQVDPGQDIVTNCDSLTWLDGNTYSSSNNSATYLIPGGAVNGCDSIVILDLTILNSTSSVFSVSACDSYTWMDGNTYFANNNSASYIMTNSVGCDSLITLDLTITDVDTTVSKTGNWASVVVPGDAYQWLDCDNLYDEVFGGTGPTFYATDGAYAVQITLNGCIDTSACISFDQSGIVESVSNDWMLFPNPTTENVNIIFTEKNVSGQLLIFNSLGEQITKVNFTSTGTLIVPMPVVPGIYTVKIISNNKTSEARVVRL